MAVNVKKRSAHNIFFGKDVETGMTKHISEVVSGAKCGCVCAFCLQPLEARKGTQRRHHFAHVSNYDCEYSNEVAIYQRVSEILDRDKLLGVPAVFLKFNNWDKATMLRDSRLLKLDDVQYHCEPLQYPPELIVSAAGSRLRILIEFDDRYYDKRDISDLIAEGKEKDYSILLLNMPRLTEGNEDFYTKEHLSRCFNGQGVPGSWMRSALEEKWRNRYLSLVAEPKMIQDWIECPLHQSSDGTPEPFYVGRWVCSRCEYCLEAGKCIGASGIRELSDFDLPPEERQAKVDALRKKNEEETAEHKRRRAESIRNMTEQQRQIKAYMDTRTSTVPAPPPPIMSKSEAQQKHDEATRIFESFDPSSAEKTVDSFGRRWVKCEICGRILQEDQIREFGGANVGLCKNCWRDGL